MNFKKQINKVLMDSLSDVMKATFSAQPKVTEYRERKGRVSEKRLAVSMGLAGTPECSLLLMATNRMACRLVSKMLGAKITTVNEDVADGVGELLNMVAGCFKRRYKKHNFEYGLSLPTVILGLDDKSKVMIRKAKRLSLTVSLKPGVSFDFFCFYASSEPADKNMKSFQSGEGIPEFQAQNAMEALRALVDKREKNVSK